MKNLQAKEEIQRIHWMFIVHDKSIFFLIPTFNLSYCNEYLGIRYSNFHRPKSLSFRIIRGDDKIKIYAVLDELLCGQHFSQQLLTNYGFLSILDLSCMRFSLKMSWNVLQWVPFSTIKIFDGLSRGQQFSQQVLTRPEFFHNLILCIWVLEFKCIDNLLH